MAKKASKEVKDYSESDVVLDDQGRGICPACGTPIKLGTAGVANLIGTHLGTIACREAAKKRDIEAKGSTMRATFKSWFTSGPKPVPKVAPKVQEPAVTRSKQGTRAVEETASARDRTNTESAPKSSARKLLLSLVPILLEPDDNVANSYLIGFEAEHASFDDPSLPIDEVWEETLNKALHGMLGWGADLSREEVAGIRPRRIRGLIKFVEYFVDQRGLSEAQGEPRLERLIKGIQKWIPASNEIRPSTLSQPSILSHPARQSPCAIDVVSDEDDTPAANPCTGYSLLVPSGSTFSQLSLWLAGWFR